MSSGSTPCGVGPPKAGPLIDALRDDSPATRLAVLDALTRLPLQPDPELGTNGLTVDF